jgi:hypothetical protein
MEFIKIFSAGVKKETKQRKVVACFALAKNLPKSSLINHYCHAWASISGAYVQFLMNLYIKKKETNLKSKLSCISELETYKLISQKAM